jgi:secretion/DNA translocation related TadE-like protein
VVAALVRSHRSAQSAADLAALAGAAARQRGEDGCAVAAELARANAAELVTCSVLGDDVLVRLEVTGPRWLGQTADLTAQARAGPGQ